jgi:hypothetical protein
MKESGELPKLKLATDLSELRIWINSMIADEKSTSGTHDNAPQSGQSQAKDEYDQLRRSLDRFSTSMLGYHQVTSFISRVVLRTSVEDFENEIRTPAVRGFELVESGEKSDIYKVPTGQVSGFLQRFSGYAENLTGLVTLMPSTLLSLVARYESYFSELVLVLLKSPHGRLAIADSQINLSDVFASNNLEDLIDKIFDDQIVSITRKSHADQVGYVEKRFNVSVQKDYPRWQSYCEIFERRNLIAHGGSIINRTYVRNCEAQGIDLGGLLVGDKLLIRPSYIQDSIDVLLEFGIKLAMVLARKNFKNEAGSSKIDANQICFDLIKRKRYKLAKDVLEWETSKQPRAVPDSIHRMSVINLANCYKKLGEENLCSATLAKEDWSACDDSFKISIASLSGKADEFFQLMPGVAAMPNVGLEGFRSWPVFDWMRTDPRYESKIEEIFRHELATNGSLPALDTVQTSSLQ